MAQFLTAKEQPIDKVFSSDYVFTIPGYQRPYSWTTEQAGELLEDLLAAVSDASKDLSDAMPYFLGSIVLIKQDSKADAQVVDGQQRLTTLTILLSSIRHVTQDQSLRDEITAYLYERGKKATGTPDRFRLTLRERDRDFFRSYVQKENSVDALLALASRLNEVESRIQTNAKQLIERLQQLSQVELERLLQFLVTRCFLVVVSTPDLDSAYRIFGVMNSRGLDLSATDVLKAEIIGSLPDALREDYTRKWEDEEESLGRDRFNDLFSHIRTVYLQAKSKATLLKDFRENVPFLRDLLKGAPRKLMDEVILPMAEDFDQISLSQFSGTSRVDAINDRLQWLNRLDFKDWVPPLLAFLLRHRNDADGVLRFLTDLERLAYSTLLRRENVNNRIRRFSDVTKSVELEADLFVESSPLQLLPQEQGETLAALDGPLYGLFPARVLALLLKRVDQLVSNQNATYVGDSSVEHVLPQNPKSDSVWIQWIPEEAQRAWWVHRLGNLVLLSRHKNSAAQNYDFERKKSTYFTGKAGVSNFALTTQVLIQPTWDMKTISGRQKELLALMAKHWRLSALVSPVIPAMPVSEAFFDVTVAGQHYGTVRAEGSKLTILKGSWAKSEWTNPETAHSYFKLREELVQSGLLVAAEKSGLLVFAEEVVVPKPSAASAVMLGRPDNGLKTLKQQGTGMSYGDWIVGAGLSALADGDSVDL